MSKLTIDDIKEKVAPIAEKYNVPTMYIFGSYAKGAENEDSDIDLVYEAKGSDVRGILKKMQFKHEIENSLDKEVDLLRVEAVDNVEPYLEDLKESYYNERILIHANKETSEERS